MKNPDLMNDDEIMAELFDPCFRCGENGVLDQDRICEDCNAIEAREFCDIMIAQFGGALACRMIGIKGLRKDGIGSDPQGKWRARVAIKHMQGRDRVNMTEIRYTWDDLYTLVFSRLSRGIAVETKRIEGVYAEDLQDTFERETGLLLTIGRRAS